MPEIFGEELNTREKFLGVPKKWLPWILGAVGAFVLLMYLRGRSGSSASSPTPVPNQLPSGGGGGMTVAVPNSSDAQTRLDNEQLQAAQLQNQYQQNLISQQQQQFDLGQKFREAILPSEVALANSQNMLQQQYAAAGANYFKQLSGKQVSCPGDASVRIDPTTGQAYCRQKTSGGILGIPVGQIAQSFVNFFTGVQQAAPQVGSQLTQAAGSYYSAQIGAGGIGSLFPRSQGSTSTGISIASPPGGYGNLQQLGGGYNVVLPNSVRAMGTR